MLKRVFAFFLVSIMVLSTLPLTVIAETWEEVIFEVYKQPAIHEVAVGVKQEKRCECGRPSGGS